MSAWMHFHHCFAIVHEAKWTREHATTRINPCFSHLMFIHYRPQLVSLSFSGSLQPIITCFVQEFPWKLLSHASFTFNCDNDSHLLCVCFYCTFGVQEGGALIECDEALQHQTQDFTTVLVWSVLTVVCSNCAASATNCMQTAVSVSIDRVCS